jgi:hypothetical protein
MASRPIASRQQARRAAAECGRFDPVIGSFECGLTALEKFQTLVEIMRTVVDQGPYRRHAISGRPLDFKPVRSTLEISLPNRLSAAPAAFYRMHLVDGNVSVSENGILPWLASLGERGGINVMVHFEGATAQVPGTARRGYYRDADLTGAKGPKSLPDLLMGWLLVGTGHEKVSFASH